MTIQRYDATQLPEPVTQLNIARFLAGALEKYGDPISHIEACLDYALGNKPEQGGAVWVAKSEQEQLLGAVVVNHTHMKAYIPEHILVYIAVAPEARGRGVGKKLMQAAIEHLPGSIALHVEADNPAVGLYESLGFQNKYLEMRLQK
jgi:ribosomal protein S18 acetylase RimI-like enzyme